MLFTAVFENRDLFISGALMTLGLSAGGWLVAVFTAVLLVAMRISPRPAFRLAGTGIVEFVRNIPPIVIVFFVYFGLPGAGIRISSFSAVVIGVGFYGGALMSEALRSGVSSLPRGQYETALATGMSYLQAMRWVVLPQAIRIVIPPLGTETINLIKNTSLGAAVSAGEIMGNANLVGSRTFAYAAVFVATGIVYICLTWPIALGVNTLERRWSWK